MGIRRAPFGYRVGRSRQTCIGETGIAAVPSRGRATSELAPEAVAARDLYERYAGAILAFCVSRLGSREEAEDAVQSTFLNAFRSLKRGVVPRAEGPWLFAIAQNVCFSRQRAGRRRDRVESSADFDRVQEVAPAPTGRGEELIGLQDALGGMPESQRRAILMREWQGLSYREIAGELGVSQGAVETLIFRARRSLADALERAPVRGRLRSLDLGSVLQSLLASGGAAAVKVAATVAVVGATGVAVSVPVVHHLSRQLPSPAAATTQATRRVRPAAPRRVAAAVVPVKYTVAPAVQRVRPTRHEVAQRSQQPERSDEHGSFSVAPPVQAASEPDDSQQSTTTPQQQDGLGALQAQPEDASSRDGGSGSSDGSGDGEGPDSSGPSS